MSCASCPAPARVGMVLLLAALVLSASPVAAQYTTSLGVINGFVEPAGWNVGELHSTYQEWDRMATLTGAAPGTVGHPAPGVPNPFHATFSPGSPTFSANPPFFGPPTFSGGALLTSTGNFYAFGPPSSDPTAIFGASADIFNYGVGNPGEGTYVVVQTGSSLADGVGNIRDTLQLVDIATGDPLIGGDNASAIISQTTLLDDVATSMGPVDYEELRYEFFLPNYFGDFRVEWDQSYSAVIDTLRVDTFIGPAPQNNAVPEASAGLGMLVVGVVAAAYAGMRRRKRATS